MSASYSDQPFRPIWPRPLSRCGFPVSHLDFEGDLPVEKVVVTVIRRVEGGEYAQFRWIARDKPHQMRNAPSSFGHLSGVRKLA
jgi:hypothetical protein